MDMMLEAKENNKDYDDNYFHRLQEEYAYRHKDSIAEKDEEHPKVDSEFSAIENKAKIEAVGNESEIPSQNELITRDDKIIERTPTSRKLVLIKRQNTKRNRK